MSDIFDSPSDIARGVRGVAPPGGTAVSDDFAELHDELRSVARDLLKAPAPDWGVLVAAGWTGLEVPEELGGAGATFAETAVILREMGRAATRSPYLGATLGIATLLAARPGPRRDDLLRQAVSGEQVPVAVLAGDPGPGPGPRLPSGWGGQADHGTFGIEGVKVSGRGEFVCDAAQASRLLILARVPGACGWPVIVDVAPGAAGLRVEPQPVADETRRLAVVTADALAVPAEESGWLFDGGQAGGPAGLLDRAAVAIACDSLGIMEEMLARTVAFAQVRQQFGRPVGAFQAVQHACADMQVQVSVARELVSAAVTAVATRDPDAWVAAGMAKSHVTAAAVAVAGKAMQLHGGIGYTWESGLHAYLKRATLNRALFGTPSAHRRRLATRYAPR